MAVHRLPGEGIGNSSFGERGRELFGDSVGFSAGGGEADGRWGLLRASWFTEQQEAFAYRSALLSGVQRVETLSRAASFATGAKLALRGDVSLAYYVCTKDLDAGDFVNGRQQVIDWSWGAFCPVYGFLLLC